MSAPEREEEAHYALAAVARMTGISAHALRAWERRYGAVQPRRTPGGSRRYSERDVQRLRLLRRAVGAGHPIGQVALLPDAEVARRLEFGGEAPRRAAAEALPVEQILAALRELDLDRVERSLALQLAVLGPRAFALELAVPLLRRVGDEWERGGLSVAAEHAASAALRTLLGATVRRDGAAASGPAVIFSTPAGERHELGALIAAAWALGAGVRSVYLGPDLPVDELTLAARTLGAGAVALGVAGDDVARSEREIRALRAALPAHVRIWLGGCAASALAVPPGVETVHRLEELEDHVRRIR
jgi:DNA-binding transcriptional MerR regulator